MDRAAYSEHGHPIKHVARRSPLVEPRSVAFSCALFNGSILLGCQNERRILDYGGLPLRFRDDSEDLIHRLITTGTLSMCQVIDRSKRFGCRFARRVG